MPAFWASGAHLVGGEISYTCNGNNNYTIKLKIYRDCNSTGAPFDPNAYIAIFDGVTGVEVTSVSPAPASIILLPAILNNPCLQTPPNVCTEMATYLATIKLPPRANGYTLTYQRCCRNGTINNIPNPGVWGNTYTVKIPPNDVSCNSSPDIVPNPPIVLCALDSLYLNTAATERDGDSLFYELCNPLHGGTQNLPMPVPPTAPPYILVPFLNPYSPGNPLPANPSIQIDGQTGLLTGKPLLQGQYVFAICVSEYRNGQLLSTVMRDYQFNVSNCQSNVQALFNAPPLLCSRQVTFTNQSINPTRYFWDFGDPNTQADTSHLPTPTYTYPLPGTYQVLLIVNRGWPCSDTIRKTIEVRDPANAQFSHNTPGCFNGMPNTFTSLGNNPADATYSWSFGSGASYATSTVKNPPPVTFPNIGTHVVSLTVNAGGCTQTVYDTIKQYLPPTIDFAIAKQTGCAPYAVQFNDASTAGTELTYMWDFGDGNTSTQASPLHVYQNSGIYSVRLTIYTTTGCIDTLQIFRPNYITVNPSPTAGFTVLPTKVTIYQPVVEVQQFGAQPGEQFDFFMDDGTQYNNVARFYHTYLDTGSYYVTQVVTNSYNCTDTLKILVRVNPVPLIFAPNAFTPNGDGKNDIYLPTVVGAREYEFIIYNRWGQVVFKTNDVHIGWDGTLFNQGAMCETAVYTFVIFTRDLNEELGEKRGTITLIR